MHVLQAINPMVPGHVLKLFGNRAKADIEAKQLVAIIGENLCDILDDDDERRGSWQVALQNDWETALALLKTAFGDHYDPDSFDVWVDDIKPEDGREIWIDIRPMAEIAGEMIIETERPDCYSIYACNPIAMHLVDIECRQDNLIESLRRAFSIADAWASHLGCDVVSNHVQRPAPEAVTAPEPEVEQFDIVESAACLWEAYLEANRRMVWAENNRTKTTFDREVLRWHEAQGWGAVRQIVIGWARECHVDWMRAVEADTFHDSFDWDFCPVWLDKKLAQTLCIEDPSAQIIALLNERSEEGNDREQYWRDCARDLWGEASRGEHPFTAEDVAIAVENDVGDDVRGDA